MGVDEYIGLRSIFVGDDFHHIDVLAPFSLNRYIGDLAWQRLERNLRGLLLSYGWRGRARSDNALHVTDRRPDNHRKGQRLARLLHLLSPSPHRHSGPSEAGYTTALKR